MVGGIGWQELGIVLVIIGVVPLILALVLVAPRGSPPYALRQWAPLPTTTIRDHALRWFGGAGWAPTLAHADALAFARKAPPNAGVAILLMFFGVVPGVLYLLLGGQRQTVTVLLKPTPDGSDLELVVNTGSSGGRASVEAFFNSLHSLVPETSVSAKVPARPVP